MASKSQSSVLKTINPDEIKPSNSTELARRGWAYYYHQDFTKARDDFMEAVQSEPGNIDFQFGLALTLKRMGKKQEAVQAFEKILEHINDLDDRVRATMLIRLAHGHINQITKGDWNLGELVWQKKV